MKRGFTVLELLVASLLLGMLMTILTMIFNQSSIAWRTGEAVTADFKEVCEKVSDVRYKADNVYVWEGQAMCIRSVFDDAGKLRTDRQISESFEGAGNWTPEVSANMQPRQSQGLSDAISSTSRSRANYVVNVMSCGPDRNRETRYDNVYSLPDDPGEW